MFCALCRRPLEYVHGHGACLDSRCPYFGLNQAECCSGETVPEQDADAAPADGASAEAGHLNACTGSTRAARSVGTTAAAQATNTANASPANVSQTGKRNRSPS